MAITQQIKQVIDAIDSNEVKMSATEAALLMLSAKNATTKRSATQTYIALARFGRFLDRPDQINSRNRVPLETQEVPEENLKTLVSKTGLAYFGPMFKSEGDQTSLKEETLMLNSLLENGFEVICLRHLTHTQLDMIFTRILESGIISNPTESLPL